jgi:hypothetical protein
MAVNITKDALILREDLTPLSNQKTERKKVYLEAAAENLALNPGFDNTGIWTLAEGWVISGGTANATTASSRNCTQTFDIIVGQAYTITFTLSNRSSGKVQPRLGGSGTVQGTSRNSDGTYTETLTAISGNTTFTFRAQDNFTGSIDNVIFSEGNHHQRHPIPVGLKVSRVFIDGKLAREGVAYDYVIKTDGINTWLKTTVEPTASTEIAVIGEQE